MGITDTLSRILRRGQARAPAVPSEPAERRVDTALIIEAARLAVTTRMATETLFMRQLSVTGETALRLLARLEHCEVISPAQSGKPRRVVATSAELPGVIAEFERRALEA